MMAEAVFDKVRSLVGLFDTCPMLLMDVLRSIFDDAEGRAHFVQARLSFIEPGSLRLF